jgi:hypothetical protein
MNFSDPSLLQVPPTGFEPATLNLKDSYATIASRRLVGRVKD